VYTTASAAASEPPSATIPGIVLRIILTYLSPLLPSFSP
jgi:hypothetical protein